MKRILDALRSNPVRSGAWPAIAAAIGTSQAHVHLTHREQDFIFGAAALVAELVRSKVTPVAKLAAEAEPFVDEVAKVASQLDPAP